MIKFTHAGRLFKRKSRKIFKKCKGMKTLTDILLEEAKEYRVYFDNYLRYLKIIKEEVKKVLKDAKVFIFGSILKGKFNPASDIDVLIVSKSLDFSKKSLVKSLLYKKIGFFSFRISPRQ